MLHTVYIAREGNGEDEEVSDEEEVVGGRGVNTMRQIMETFRIITQEERKRRNHLIYYWQEC